MKKRHKTEQRNEKGRLHVFLQAITRRKRTVVSCGGSSELWNPQRESELRCKPTSEFLRSYHLTRVIVNMHELIILSERWPSGDL